MLLSREWLPLEVETYAEVVKKKGYHTFFVGKWHLGDDHFGPQKQGFDTAWSNAGAGAVKSYYAPYFQEKGFWNDIPNNQYLTDYCLPLGGLKPSPLGDGLSGFLVSWEDERISSGGAYGI